MKTKQSQEVLYLEYLDNHIKGVGKAWELIKKASVNTKWYSDKFIVLGADLNIPEHDKSKYSAEEFEKYRQYYYPADDEVKNDEIFEEAWSHHKDFNLHHWESMGNITNQRDKFVYTLELIADWMSVGYMKNEGVMDYYDKNKDKVVLEHWQHELIVDTYRLIGEYLYNNNISFSEYMNK
jgi:hypothetical protein